MKKEYILLIVILVCFATHIYSQEFSIIKVKGDISYAKSGTQLKIQDKIESSINLSYEGLNDYAVGFNTDYGSRYFRKEKESNETNYLPTMPHVSYSIRIEKPFFTDTLLLIDEVEISIDTTIEADLFDIEYYYDKNRSIDLPLPNNDIITIRRDDIFQFQKNIIKEYNDVYVRLVFLSNNNFILKKIKLICPDIEKLSREVADLKRLSANIKQEKQDEYLLQYLNAEYGKIELSTMKKYLKSINEE